MSKIIETPEVGPAERRAIEQISDLQVQLRHYTTEPRRWTKSIRRAAQAAALAGSNSIEGYAVSMEDAIAVAGGAEPTDNPDSHAVEAIKAYQRAMTYVLQAARDANFEYSTGLLKAIHFMTTEFDFDAQPGLVRSGPVFVVHRGTGDLQYTGPDAELCTELVDALCEHLNTGLTGVPMVDAAMAHLNLVNIHPFKDGNGRMSRILQALVLARSGTLVPEFASIEEYLGNNTTAYYRILQEVGGAFWDPTRDAREWIRFCLNAHYAQAALLLRRIRHAEDLWTNLETIVKDKGLHERTVGPLYDASIGHKIRNASYLESVKDSTGVSVSAQTATNDLRALVDAGLLEAHGAKRGAHYLAAEELAMLQLAGQVHQRGKVPNIVDLFA